MLDLMKRFTLIIAALLSAVSCLAIASDPPLRSLMPSGAHDVHERKEGSRDQLSYKKVAKYPATAVADSAREELERHGWKPCTSKAKGWRNYPELKDGKQFEVHSQIEYYLRDTSVLRLAFFYRLDQARGESLTDGKTPQTVSIERIDQAAKSSTEAKETISSQGYSCM